MPDEIAATDTSAAAAAPVVDSGAAPAPAGDQASPQAGQGGAAAQGQGASEGSAAEGGAVVSPPEGGQGQEGAQAEAPITYTDFKLPDGLAIPDALRDGIVAVGQAHKMNQDQAQALVDLGVQQAKALGEHFAAQAVSQPVLAVEHWATEWSQQTASDPQLGGEKLVENMGLVNKVFSTFGNEALGTFLKSTGLEHHPELIRFMHRVGKAVSEDTLVTPQGGASRLGHDPAKKLYPSMN